LQQQFIKTKFPEIFIVLEGISIKIVYLCKTFTGTPDFGQCMFVSKPDVLFYSVSHLVSNCGLVSVQKNEERATLKHALTVR
jgi:hypothetical protein